MRCAVTNRVKFYLWTIQYDPPLAKSFWLRNWQMMCRSPISTFTRRAETLLIRWKIIRISSFYDDLRSCNVFYLEVLLILIWFYSTYYYFLFLYIYYLALIYFTFHIVYKCALHSTQKYLHKCINIQGVLKRVEQSNTL